MFAKVFLLSPLLAVTSFVVSQFSRVDWNAVEQGLVDFVVVGQIPFSNNHISYDSLLLLCTIGIWASFTYRFTKLVIKRATKTIHANNNFDLIAL